MTLNRCNPTLWFAWYPVWTENRGPQWLRRVWWWREPNGYHVHSRGMYQVFRNAYAAFTRPDGGT